MQREGGKRIDDLEVVIGVSILAFRDCDPIRGLVDPATIRLGLVEIGSLVKAIGHR
jgi:hypothetical protein